MDRIEGLVSHHASNLFNDDCNKLPTKSDANEGGSEGLEIEDDYDDDDDYDDEEPDWENERGDFTKKFNAVRTNQAVSSNPQQHGNESREYKVRSKYDTTL
uniref:Uncharacterized protein n=1 Tax=Plectus sambesii TaxID=2011161 RepID=A0A914VFY4_9BILA